MKIGNARSQCRIEDIVAAFEAGGLFLPSSICFALFSETQHHAFFLRAGRLIADSTGDRVQQFTEAGCWNFKVPSQKRALYLVRRCLKPNGRFSGYAVQANVEKKQRISLKLWFVVVTALISRTSPNLEHVYKVGFYGELNQ